MAEEKILLDINFNEDDIKSAINNIAKSRQEIDKLIEANKQLIAQGQKNSAEYVKNQEAIKGLNKEVANNSKIVQGNTQAVEQNANSIEQLKKRNSELLKERNKLDTSTEEGRKKIAELNAEYDKNSKIIADNSTKVEQQRFNIGNYKSALEGVVPGLSGVSSATDTASKAATGFKLALGPVGLIIGAVATALGFLLKAFFGTQEGMDKLSKVTTVVSTVFEKIKGVAQELGGKVFKVLSDAIDNPKQAFIDLGNAIKENIINRFEALALFGPAIKKIFSGDIADGFKDLGNAVIQAGTGIENGIDKIVDSAKSLAGFVSEAIDQGLRLDELQKQIEKAELKQIVRSKELELQIKKNKAIVEDETKSYQERQEAAKAALDAQNEALNNELSLLDKRIEKLKLQQSLNDTSREDQKELAELEAQKLELQARTTEQSIEFSKKITEIQRKQAADELAIVKNIEQLKLDVLGDSEQAQIKKIQETTQAKIEALKGSEAQIAEARTLLIQKQEQDIADVQEKARLDREAKQKEAEDQARAAQQEALQQSLDDYSEYVTGLINEKKRQLLEDQITQEEYNQEIADLQIAANEVQLAIKEQFGIKDLAQEGAIVDAKLALKKREAEETERLEKFKVNAVQSTIGQVANLFNRQSVAFKALASAQTLIQTYQSAQAVFTGMTSTIPGPVGVALGIAGAAAAVLQGLANVNRINAVNPPRLEEGGVIDIGGKRHSAGGEDVYVGGKRVANVEQGESMVVLKRGASPLLRNLSTINQMVGGRSFFNDRAPRTHLADGGFVARSAVQTSQFNQLSIAEDLKNVKIVTRVSDLRRVEANELRASFTSELT